MLKELALLVTLLALFADARPQPSKLKDTLIEMSDEVEENSDSLTNSNDILEEMIVSYLRAKNAGSLKAAWVNIEFLPMM
eukprot:Em0009g88a